MCLSVGPGLPSGSEAKPEQSAGCYQWPALKSGLVELGTATREILAWDFISEGEPERDLPYDGDVGFAQRAAGGGRKVLVADRTVHAFGNECSPRHHPLGSDA